MIVDDDHRPDIVAVLLCKAQAYNPLGGLRMNLPCSIGVFPKLDPVLLYHVLASVIAIVPEFSLDEFVVARGTRR